MRLVSDSDSNYCSLRSCHCYHSHNKGQSEVNCKIPYFQHTFEGHGDGDVKDGNDLALALVDIDITGDGGDGEGLDGGAVGLGGDTAQLGLEVSLGPVDAVFVNPVPIEKYVKV